MKKIMLLSIMLFAVAITSCEKDDAEPSVIKPTQTLEQKYPAWVNLSFIERVPANVNQDWISIKLENNQVLYNSGNKFGNSPTATFKQMNVEYDSQSTNTLKVGKAYFYDYYQGDGLIFEFEMNLVSKKFKYYLNNGEYYLLKIN